MRPVLGNGLVMLLVVAATAAVVLVPVALRGGDPESPAPVPAAVSESVTETPHELEAEAEAEAEAEMVVTERQQADVDGDARPDEVRLLEDPTVEIGEASVEVVLANGTTSAAPVPFGYPSLQAAMDINRDGRQQVLMTHSAGGDEAQLLVFGWHDGALIQMQRDADASLGFGGDGPDQYLDYFVDDGELFSWLRLEPVDSEHRPLVHAEMWSWSVEGDRLAATSLGTVCVDVTTRYPRPRPCTFCGH